LRRMDAEALWIPLKAGTTKRIQPREPDDFIVIRLHLCLSTIFSAKPHPLFRIML